MVHISKVLIFVAEILVLLMLLIIVLSPQGIASNTVNYLGYIEPILIQYRLSTSLALADSSSGDYVDSLQTLGFPETIKIIKQNNVVYVQVIPALETFIRTDFANLNPTPVVIQNCQIAESDLKLRRDVVQKIFVTKRDKSVPCRGDVNSDQVIDQTDVNLVQSHQSCDINDPNCFIYDVNDDGTVDNNDLSYVQANQGVCLFQRICELGVSA